MVVVDLDGTLFPGNTLREYTLYALRHSPNRLEIAFWVALRRAKLVSHRRMKWHILKASADLDCREFVESVYKNLSQPVQKLLATFRGAEVVIATAAPERYSLPLAKKLGCRCIATPDAERYSEYVENRGEVKLRRVLDLNLPIRAVVTDHHDDLPLLKLEGVERYLVSPSPETRKRVGEMGIECEVICGK